MLVKRGLLWMYVCLQVPPKKQKEKKKKNPEAPHRPHTLAALSCKEPQLPSPAPTPNHLTTLHLQTQTQSFSKVVMVRQHNEEQGWEAASVIYKNDWNDE